MIERQNDDISMGASSNNSRGPQVEISNSGSRSKFRISDFMKGSLFRRSSKQSNLSKNQHNSTGSISKFISYGREDEDMTMNSGNSGKLRKN